MNSSIDKDQLLELIEQAGEKGAEKAVEQFNQELFEAAMKKRKRGKKYEQAEESESIR